MSATPRLVARGSLSGGYYWFNFFRCRLNLFLYIFYSRYDLQFCIFYNPHLRPGCQFDLAAQPDAISMDTVFSNPE
jgi:hypothetical protein